MVCQNRAELCMISTTVDKGAKGVDIMLFFVFQELQMDIQDHATSVDYINRTGTELHQKAPEEKAKKLKEDMDSMNKRWEKVSEEIDDRVEKLKATLEQIKQHQVRRLNNSYIDSLPKRNDNWSKGKVTVLSVVVVYVWILHTSGMIDSDCVRAATSSASLFGFVQKGEEGRGGQGHHFRLC